METVGDLVRQAQGGDDRAFGALVERYLRAAHAVALAELGDLAAAEDACQDAFPTALERLDDCRRPERFGGWLMEIVRNRARNIRRAGRLRQTEPLDPEARVLAVDASREAELVELRVRLEAALRDLPRVQREVVLLHDVEGLRHAEIADALGISTGASRVQLHRARAALRTQLAPIRRAKEEG